METDTDSRPSRNSVGGKYRIGKKIGSGSVSLLLVSTVRSFSVLLIVFFRNLQFGELQTLGDLALEQR